MSDNSQHQSTLHRLLGQLENHPVAFTEVMAVIEQCYHFQPTQFKNGPIVNSAGENNGSCKIFAFAKKQGLSVAATLHAFGDFYSQDVLANPEGTSHQNIRQFMQIGWQGISFLKDPLLEKT